MAHHDGLISIRKGFKKNELTSILEQVNSSHVSISWRWAFRYLAIADLRPSHIQIPQANKPEA